MHMCMTSFAYVIVHGLAIHHMCLSMDRQVANFDILQLWPMFVHLYNCPCHWQVASLPIQPTHTSGPLDMGCTNAPVHKCSSAECSSAHVHMCSSAPVHLQTRSEMKTKSSAPNIAPWHLLGFRFISALISSSKYVSISPTASRIEE